MQTDLWYELELRELAGTSAAAELIHEAEAARLSADEPDIDRAEPAA